MMRSPVPCADPSSTEHGLAASPKRWHLAMPLHAQSSMPYLSTLLLRDVRDLANIEGLNLLPRVLALLAKALCAEG